MQGLVRTKEQTGSQAWVVIRPPLVAVSVGTILHLCGLRSSVCKVGREGVLVLYPFQL